MRDYQNLADDRQSADFRPFTAPAPTAPAPKKGQSLARILATRLRLNNCKPRAWVVAQILAAYSRQKIDSEVYFATLYHEKIAAETGMSVATVRLAARELTEGPAPLYIKRGTTGQRRKVRGKNGWTLDTSAVVYEWIADLPAFLAARDTARAANLIDFAERQREVHADKVRLQGQQLTGQLDASTATSEIAKLDRKARGKLPARAIKHKTEARCLTAKQVRQYAVEIVDERSYGELIADDVNHRELYALRKHVLDSGCLQCQRAVVDEWKRAGRNAEMLTGLGVVAIEPCGCGLLVTQWAGYAADFWSWAASGQTHKTNMHENCPHELNRQLKLKQQALNTAGNGW